MSSRDGLWKRKALEDNLDRDFRLIDWNEVSRTNDLLLKPFPSTDHAT